MTIDEAIKILTNMPLSIDYSLDPYKIQAIKLGIEALERFKHYRSWGTMATNLSLPGETKS